MIKVLMINKDKDTLEIDFTIAEYNYIFKEYDRNNFKKHKTLKELQEEVKEFIKGDK